MQCLLLAPLCGVDGSSTADIGSSAQEFKTEKGWKKRFAGAVNGQRLSQELQVVEAVLTSLKWKLIHRVTQVYGSLSSRSWTKSVEQQQYQLVNWLQVCKFHSSMSFAIVFCFWGSSVQVQNGMRRTQTTYNKDELTYGVKEISTTPQQRQLLWHSCHQQEFTKIM